ncbi:MAG: hypothetical protein N2C14_18180 [Planctomycetales bacterium]
MPASVALECALVGKHGIVAQADRFGKRVRTRRAALRRGREEQVEGTGGTGREDGGTGRDRLPRGEWGSPKLT